MVPPGLCPLEILRAAIKDVADFVQGKMAGYKRPRRIEFLEGLPKTATGKVQRYKLR